MLHLRRTSLLSSNTFSMKNSDRASPAVELLCVRLTEVSSFFRFFSEKVKGDKPAHNLRIRSGLTIKFLFFLAVMAPFKCPFKLPNTVNLRD